MDRVPREDSLKHACDPECAASRCHSDRVHASVSTSGQAIAVSIFAVFAIRSLDRVRLNDVIPRPAVWLPVLLVTLIIVGVLWSKLPIDQAIKWISRDAKLSLIPLAMAATFSQRQIFEISL